MKTGNTILHRASVYREWVPEMGQTQPLKRAIIINVLLKLPVRSMFAKIKKQRLDYFSPPQ